MLQRTISHDAKYMLVYDTPLHQQHLWCGWSSEFTKQKAGNFVQKNKNAFVHVLLLVL